MISKFNVKLVTSSIMLLLSVTNFIPYKCLADRDQSTPIGWITPTHLNNLKEFFSTTYIEKVARDRGYGDCFKEGWNLYHFHHVCTRGGQDGIVIGVDGVDNDWSHMNLEPGREPTYSADEWNRVVLGSAAKGTTRIPTEAIRIDPKEIGLVKYVRGPTLFMNCFQQTLESSNPAHWMMKLGTLFELSTCIIDTHKSFPDVPDIFNPHWPTPLKRFYMHQCSDPNLTGWNWGQVLFKIVEKALKMARILDKNYEKVDVCGYEKTKKTEIKIRVPPYEISCFEDIYMSQRNGVWLNKPDNLIALRAATVKELGEPAELLKTPELISDSQPLQTKPAYCPQGKYDTVLGITKTRARIRIFQRTATQNLRSFVNLQAVIELVQQFTILPVKVITVNSTTTVEDQIRIFNDFDLLITPHGSHLANGIYTVAPHTKGIIEVVSFAFDRVFYSNFNSHLGFANYVLSTGHLTPPQPHTKGVHCAFNKTSVFTTLNCNKLQHNYPGHAPQIFLECPNLYHTRACDTMVNLKILKRHLLEMFSNVLCKDPDPTVPA